MSTMEITESYVYMVKNKKTGHWYIGKQANPRKVIGLSYFTTSVSKHPMAKWFQGSFASGSEELNDWDVEILFQGEDYEEAEEVLIELMGLYHPENNPLSLNFGNTGGSFSRHGTVTVYDYILGSTVAIPQEEYYLRKQNGEVISAMEHPETIAKYQDSCMENLGVTHPLLSVEVQAKSKKTCLMNFGVPHSMQSPEVKYKAQSTCMENFGVSYPMQSPEVQAKSKETCIKNYGVDSPLKSPEIQDKFKETLMINYGVSNPSQSPEIQAKKAETCMENYGVDNPFKSLEIQDKVKETLMNNYGVTHPSHSPEIRAKAQATCLDKYGHKYSLHSPEIHAKVLETWMENYGVSHPSKSPVVKAKTKATCLERYNVEHPGCLNGVSVVAFIIIDNEIILISKFNNQLQALKKTNIYNSSIGKSCANPLQYSAGIFDLCTNSFYAKTKQFNGHKLPSEKYPTYHRVYWMSLKDFNERYPDKIALETLLKDTK